MEFDSFFIEINQTKIVYLKNTSWVNINVDKEFLRKGHLDVVFHVKNFYVSRTRTAGTLTHRKRYKIR